MKEIKEKLWFWLQYHNHGYTISTIPEIDAKNIIDAMNPKIFKLYLSTPYLEDIPLPIKNHVNDYVNHLHYTHFKKVKKDQKFQKNIPNTQLPLKKLRILYSRYLTDTLVLVKYLGKTQLN